jgi:hypothetical protein
MDVNLGEVHLGPVDPWNPNYIEDPSFKACVPISDSYVEAPMEIYKDANENYAWCEKVYPTQNPYWLFLNQYRRKNSSGTSTASLAVNYPNYSPVKYYTSYEDGVGFLASRNTCTGTLPAQICESTLGVNSGTDYTNCVSYLSSVGIMPSYSSGIPRSTTTCDRTVTFDSNRNRYEFPLQAQETDIVDMLKADLVSAKNFTCAYSVSSDATKVGKAFPSSGCCGMVGGVNVLNGMQVPGSATYGHLEPQKNPAFPDIRFCGSPVR